MKEQNNDTPREPREKPERDEMSEAKDREIVKLTTEAEAKAQAEAEQNEYTYYEQCFVDMFDSIQAEVHESAIDKGWWQDYTDLLIAINRGDERNDMELLKTFQKSWQLSKIALIHAELSECVEGIRDKSNTPDQHCPEFSQQEIELADMVIRAMDLSEKFKWRLGLAIIAKKKFNKTRAYKHGKVI